MQTRAHFKEKQDLEAGACSAFPRGWHAECDGTLAQRAQPWQARPMVTKRTIHEEGHSRKFLVVIDETSECDRAVSYAARRALRTNGTLTMLVVIEPGQFQHWLGVKEIMIAEAREAAQEKLDHFKEKVESIVSVPIECVLREGKLSEQIIDLIDKDEDIGILVLAAAVSPGEGPGPLVSSIATKSDNAFPIPVTIVPGDLSDEDIIALS